VTDKTSAAKRCQSEYRLRGEAMSRRCEKSLGHRGACGRLARGFLERGPEPWFSWRRQFRWWWTCRVRRKYGSGSMEVYRTINPQLPPPRTTERLRQRVLSGDWESE